jgi:hypothetical protein
LQNEGVADDEIERLIREVEAATSGTPRRPAEPSKEVEKPKADGKDVESSSGGRVAFAGISAGVMGVGGWLFGVFTPWTDALDMGIAAAGAAFLTGLIAGPPKWFSS